MHHQTSLLNSNWIWLPQEEKSKHQYVCFRKKIRLDSTVTSASNHNGINNRSIKSENYAQNAQKDITNKNALVHLDISVDSDFIVIINNREVGRGQFSDYPEEKTFTRFDVEPYLKKGDNIIAILAYYRGENFSDHRAGKAGLIVSLEVDNQKIYSDNSWKCMQHPAFKSGNMPKVTGQQGFTTHFDARKNIDWASDEFNDEKWNSAEIKAQGISGFWKTILPRPVPILDFGKALGVTILTQGAFIRKSADFTATAEIMQNDALIAKHRNKVFEFTELSVDNCSSPKLTHHIDGVPVTALLKPQVDFDGAYFILDFGQEEVGLINFDIEAPAGTVVEVGHGEHLVDGRLRILLGGRKFADSYICCEGENSYTLPFRRIGGRFLEVHVSNFNAPVKIKYFGLRPLTLPNIKTCEFSTSDSMTQYIHNISVHAMKCCMHEHYEDTPWREQSLYAFDGRNQALYGYYAFGNYDFAATSFDLLGRGIRDDGFLELCAPAKNPITIPIFSFVWITALKEHWMHSGDSKLFNKFKKQIKMMLDIAFKRQDNDSKLYIGPSKDSDKWHFYEWVPGLDEYDKKTPDGRLDAPYNLFLHEAMSSYMIMLKLSGDNKESELICDLASELGKNIVKYFWDSDKKYLNTFISEGKKYGVHQLIQCLALSENILNIEQEKELIDKLTDPMFEKMTLSSMLYLMKAVVGKDDKTLSETIHSCWGKMVQAGATTCWETIKGDADFDSAGSLCHAWSALPVYYYHSHVLGVKPLSPGFKTFTVKPYTNDFSYADGEVMTPYGKIAVKWEKTKEGLTLVVNPPAECQQVN